MKKSVHGIKPPWVAQVKDKTPANLDNLPVLMYSQRDAREYRSVGELLGSSPDSRKSNELRLKKIFFFLSGNLFFIRHTQNHFLI